MRNHYITLGVCRGDAEDELKKAFRKLAKENHPDQCGNDPAKAAIMAEVNIAWGVLGGGVTRNAYNKRQAALYGTCEPCKGNGFTYKQRGFNGRILSKCPACKGAGTEKEEK